MKYDFIDYRWWGISEAAKVLKVTRRTFYDWIKKGVVTSTHGSFNSKYIKIVRGLLPRKRERGLLLLTPKIEKKIREIKESSYMPW